MKLNEIEKGTLIEISYALGKENIVIKKETKNNNISKKVLKNSSLHNKKLPSVVIEIDEDNYVPYGQVTIAMLEAHKGPDVYIWNKISGEVVHHNEKLYLLIFSQKDAITRNLRSSVRFEKIGFGTIIPENNGKKINITLKDVSKTGFGIYVNSLDGIKVNEEVYYEINIKEDNQIKQGKARIVRICKDNNKDFIGLQVI